MEGIALVKVDVARTVKKAVEATIEANIRKVEQVGNETTATEEEREMLCKAFLEQMAAKGHSSNDVLDEIGGKQLSFHTTKSEEELIDDNVPNREAEALNADNVPNGEAEVLKESPDAGALNDEVKEDESANEIKLQEGTIELRMWIEAEIKRIRAILAIKKKATGRGTG
jgi:hypothetical protein